MKKIQIALVSAAVLIIISTVIVVSTIRTYGVTSNQKELYFNIEKGATLKQISMQLKERNIIKSSEYFVIYTKFIGAETKIQAGNYIIRPNMKLKDLILKFQSAKSDYVIVTIPEGYSLYQIADKLAADGLVNRDTFLNLKLKDIGADNLIHNSGKVNFELEGYLFPDTYYIPKGMKEADIAKMMFDQFKKVYTEEDMARAKELNLSTDQIITIASLIEKEAANDSERKTIAGVIYNRMRIGMPLQIDASVIYAITKGERHIDELSYNDLKTKSDYNTYLNKTLPPGPIASPGKPSIEAALNPEKNNYLYYVLGDNGHVFSSTYSQQLKNISKYLKKNKK